MHEPSGGKHLIIVVTCTRRFYLSLAYAERSSVTVVRKIGSASVLTYLAIELENNTRYSDTQLLAYDSLTSS
jgi:hypothetical protein